MELSKYIIIDIKNAILNSRYQAARLVNRELIVLYFSIGKKISDTARKEAWGSKVLEHISAALQLELPGLKGFSAGNLKKMRVFADFWSGHFNPGSAVPNQLPENFATYKTSEQLPPQFKNALPDAETLKKLLD